ncbi:MAG: hypothetical protein ABSF53_04320 [Terracidiphilus sp.]
MPSIGRVMQFRLAGDANGTFWENPALAGRMAGTHTDEWFNFGGDKCWPAPQSAWQQQQARAWPPPPGFDCPQMTAIIGESELILTSQVDAAWGIQIVRSIALEPRKPIMRIHSEYHKTLGSPVQAGIWSITQMQEPEAVCIHLNSASSLTNGYLRLFDAEPKGLMLERGVLSFARHREAYTKIGADGAALAWIGPTSVVRIDVEPQMGEYPDGGCITEIYTNPNPLNYVELETLGPMSYMNIGDRMHLNVTYTISPRSNLDSLGETESIFREISFRPGEFDRPSRSSLQCVASHPTHSI